MSEPEFEVYKAKSVDLFKEIIPSLTVTKKHLIDTLELEESKFPVHIINKHFSYSSETIFLSNEINKFERVLNPRQVYDFWFYVLEPKKRFDRWIKPEQTPEELELIREYYGCSDLKSRQYLKVLTPDQINILKTRLGKD